MFKNVFSFRGRIRRTEFGISYALVLICIFSLTFIVEKLEISGVPVLVHLTAIYWFSFSQGAKRCHDMGNSGFFQLIPFYIFVMFFSEGEKRNNKYGQDPKLVELQERELNSSAKTKEITLPEGKQMVTVISELISGILLTVLAVTLLGYLDSNSGWPYYIVESLIIMGGYYLVLSFGFKRGEIPKLTNYCLLHRAVFSLSFYVCIWIYEVYSNNVSSFEYTAIGADISNIIAIFTLTYIPYLIFTTKKSPNFIPLEA